MQDCQIYTQDGTMLFLPIIKHYLMVLHTMTAKAAEEIIQVKAAAEMVLHLH